MVYTSPHNDAMPKRVEIDDGLHAIAESKCPKYLSVTGFINLILDQGLDRGVTLTERATASTQEGGASVVSSSSSSNKRTNSLFIKSLQPSLQCHEDLILGFWKAKTGSKSEAGWKLLNTELVKIQEAYGDKVVRDQLELATANRWKGVTLKNYEQFGLNKQPHRDDGIDYEALDKIRTGW